MLGKPNAVPIFKNTGEPEVVNVSKSAGTEENHTTFRKRYVSEPIALKDAMQIPDANAAVDQ